jgi:hypothetical protein
VLGLRRALQEQQPQPQPLVQRLLLQVLLHQRVSPRQQLLSQRRVLLQ